MENFNTSQTNTSIISRPPVVVIMGHIDHGKTKILDWYRKTKMVERETGGITQHIGAYEVEHHGKKITFIDTPGHEAFSKLRSRGARIADIAILVVAADEGVKPQTKEAIEIIRQNSLPLAVALNKIDKPETNPERVKQELAQENILVESYGGKIPAVEISAKTGKNMDGLLEILLLLAELENLQAHPEKTAEGVIIETNLDPKIGIIVTLLIRDGILKKTYFLVTGRSVEKIKILKDFLGRPIEEAGPSSPVLIVGFSSMPPVGETFQAFPDKETAEKFINQTRVGTSRSTNESIILPSAISISAVDRNRQRSNGVNNLGKETTGKIPAEKPKESAAQTSNNESRPIFNIILKTDVAGSREALEENIKKLESEAVGVKIIKSEVGEINETDIKLAMATNLVTVVGFKVRMDASTRELAQNANVHIFTGEVIYELLDKIKKEMEEMIPPLTTRIVLGRAKILKIFKKDGSKQIVGGRVEEGKIIKGALVDIKRKMELLGQGTILQLQREKRETEEALVGQEFGVMIEAGKNIQEGDIIEIYREEIMPQRL